MLDIENFPISKFEQSALLLINSEIYLRREFRPHYRWMMSNRFSFKREFVIPLAPFIAEFVSRICFLNNASWWEYPDSGTMVLTASIWSLFMLRKVPNETSILRDSEVLQQRESLKDWFMVISIFGIIFFGIISFMKILYENDPAGFDPNQEYRSGIAILALIYGAASIGFISLNINPIRRTFG